MYLKWQGQFLCVCCGGASSSSPGVAGGTSCWWLCDTGWHLCALAQPRQDTPRQDKPGGEAASQDIPGVGGRSGRSGCSNTERRWWGAKPDSWTQERWGLGDLWRQRSFSIPFPCCLLLQQLAHSCATASASAELSAGQFGLFLITCDSWDFYLLLWVFLWGLATEAWLQPHSLHTTPAAASNKPHLLKESLKKLRTKLFFFFFFLNIEPVFTFALLHLYLYPLIQFLCFLCIYTVVDG